MRLAWFSALADLPPVLEAILKVTALLALGWMIHLGIRRANPRWRVLLWRGVAVAILCLPLLGLLLPKLNVPISGRADEPGPAPIVQSDATGEAPASAGPLVGEEFPAASVAELSEPAALSPDEPLIVSHVVDWLGSSRGCRSSSGSIRSCGASGRPTRRPARRFATAWPPSMWATRTPIAARWPGWRSHCSVTVKF